MDVVLGLSLKEVEVLQKAITIRIHEVYQETLQASDRSSKKNLKTECDCLEEIGVRLEGSNHQK